MGVAVGLRGALPPHVAMFSESASRVVVSVDPVRAAELEDLAGTLRVPLARLGETGGPRLVVDGVLELALAVATTAYEEAIPKLLAG
jgi:phosphoribosylformylglycinamidine synthase